MAEVLLSEDEAVIVERGDQARSLLDNPSFLHVTDALRTDCAEAILTSEPQALAAREDAYNLSRGLSAITERLIAIVSEGDAILARAEAETEQQSSSEYADGSY